MKSQILLGLLFFVVTRPALAQSAEQSIGLGIGETVTMCTVGQTREYSRSDLTLQQQTKLADDLIKLSYRICEAQPPVYYQEKIYGVCLGGSAQLSMVIRYRCATEETFATDPNLSFGSYEVR